VDLTRQGVFSQIALHAFGVSPSVPVLGWGPQQEDFYGTPLRDLSARGGAEDRVRGASLVPASDGHRRAFGTLHKREKEFVSDRVPLQRFNGSRDETVDDWIFHVQQTAGIGGVGVVNGVHPQQGRTGSVRESFACFSGKLFKYFRFS
jgi:hypothetical protein